MADLFQRPGVIGDALDRYGSPVNILWPEAMTENAAELEAAAGDMRLQVFFARKANKALAFVDQARRLDLGLDVASLAELVQTIEAGVSPEHIIVSAAVKPDALLEAALQHGVTVALDNRDESVRLAWLSQHLDLTPKVALRVSPELDGVPPSRFGATRREWIEWLRTADLRPLQVAGVHFHLAGYDPAQRASMLLDVLPFVDRLRELGHPVSFVDMGGGLPVQYLPDGEQWDDWWAAHRLGLADGRPLTYDGHGLGLRVIDGRVVGTPNVYPFAQAATRGPWLLSVLDHTDGSGTSIATHLTRRSLELRCEPGRSLLDQGGLTAARVEFVKRRADGVALIGLLMNRTQCRTTTDEFMIDPIVLANDPDPARATEGYLVGAYCMETELILWRRLVFPTGIRRGDIVVFPNTAGYYMHFLESPSHQIPLAANLIWDGETMSRDGIDSIPGEGATR